jgi:asparagine synthase (glutamine-hydrolysing)
MCGIAGMMGTEPGCVAEEATLRRMCDAIAHRGPDDQGYYINGPVGLGMRRLSIIDLSTGHQPIANEDGSIWIVFNGEIYNFCELRQQLRTRGHRFRTHTDTEVIVHLYEDLGHDCVLKLRGMFAFAIYDFRNHSLLLARDRLGKKPLHYAVSGDWLVFGSEIKSLLEAAPGLSEINREGVLSYFYFGYIPDPQSAFRSIHKLPPGHFLEYRNQRLDVKRYWDVPAYGTHESISEEECLEELERRLAEAVRIRLISDVPLGALLSGGVDSSVIVALMAQASSRPVKTFTIGFEHGDFNEAQHARAVTKIFQTEHQELVLKPDVVGTLEKLTPALEEPFADSSILPTYYVSRLARRYVTVALSGDGGDELFAGYDRYTRLLRRNQLNQLPQWAGRFYRGKLYPRLPTGLYGRRFLFNLTLPWRDRYLDSVNHFPVWGRERALFSPDFLAWADSVPSPLELFRRYFDEAPANDLVSRLLYLDTKTYLPFDILTKVDRMSMATSLEVRVPMLDHVFLEWVTGLPTFLKLRNLSGKYILKKLAERLGVPTPVLDRPKQGFALPLVHWMREELKGDLVEILLERRTLERGYYRKSSLEKLVKEHSTGRRDRSHEIWLLLMLELWHRNFLERRSGTLAESNAIPVARASS